MAELYKEKVDGKEILPKHPDTATLYYNIWKWNQEIEIPRLNLSESSVEFHEKSIKNSRSIEKLHSNCNLEYTVADSMSIKPTKPKHNRWD